ncbi:hypothetical protein NIASO_19665 [Niabella soli DSM 19437]|uniref:Uncharacterized protein n=1 Tax=Niabella soli DSM 19437 TaxID=929713 RepID=W0F9I8_9BACT|nr:hypothetical protein NIASO_19665 [Niabella soli DSM 19437]
MISVQGLDAERGKVEKKVSERSKAIKEAG